MKTETKSNAWVNNDTQAILLDIDRLGLEGAIDYNVETAADQEYWAGISRDEMENAFIDLLEAEGIDVVRLSPIENISGMDEYQPSLVEEGYRNPLLTGTELKYSYEPQPKLNGMVRNQTGLCWRNKETGRFFMEM